MNVLIAGGGTGGHLMPALALAEALVEEDPSVDPVLVGAERGIEASILPDRQFRHYLLPLEPFYRREWWKNLRWPLLAFQTVRQCSRVLDVERPRVTIGTGGYASGPILYLAGRRGIPLAIQEQNAVPGLATKWLARRAQNVFLGFPEAATFLRCGSSTDVHDFGNPISRPPDPRPERRAARSALGVGENKRVLLVFGGSQGALSINKAISGILDAGGLDDVVLLWSTGRLTWDSFSHYHSPPRRIVKAFWDPMTAAYAAADLVVARAGAMTTAEICAWGLPSVLVPLPSAAADHQSMNAAALAGAGAAVHLPERELTPDRLESILGGLLADADALSQIRDAATVRGRPEAAQNIARRVLEMVS